VKETVSVAPAVTAQEAVLPGRVQEALGELVGAAKEGLLALSVATGLGVLAELLEDEVDDVVGPKGKRNPDRTAVRPRGRRGHARRPARGRRAPAGQDRRRRQRGAAGHLCALRRPRSADPGRARADACRRLDPPLRAHA
jgi:hypothetical protein